MAVALAEAGADIVATSAGMEAAGSTVEREVAARGRRCWTYACDLADRPADRVRSGGSTGGVRVRRKGEGGMPSGGYPDQKRRHDSAQAGGRAKIGRGSCRE